MRCCPNFWKRKRTAEVAIIEDDDTTCGSRGRREQAMSCEGSGACCSIRVAAGASEVR
jgi:hypothetical protein